MKDWMTTDDLREYLQIPPAKIRELIRLNKIPFHDKLGSTRFFKQEIDEWMRTPEPERGGPGGGEETFMYRGKPIKEYMLSASRILTVETAWHRLPSFITKTEETLDKRKRPYLRRQEFEPFMANFNDYLRVSCQLGIIDSIREGREARYYPTKYARMIHADDSIENVRQVLFESVLEIVKRNKETTPRERHAIFLLWYILKIKEAGVEPGESHFRKAGEDTFFPLIRLNFSKSFCDFLFQKDRGKEREFLRRSDAEIADK